MIKQQQKKKTIIPEFKNYQEEAAWFDSHDLSDYWHELNQVDIDFQLEKPKEENIVVRVQKPIKDRIEKIARRKGAKHLKLNTYVDNGKAASGKKRLRTPVVKTCFYQATQDASILV